MIKRLLSFVLILCIVMSFTSFVYAADSYAPYIYKESTSVRIGSTTTVGFSYGGTSSSVETICSNLCAEAYVSGTTLYIKGLAQGTCFITLKFNDGTQDSIQVDVGNSGSSSSRYDENEEELEILKGDYENIYIDLQEYGASRATITYDSSNVSVNKTTFYSSGNLKVTGKSKGSSTLKIKYSTGETEYYYIDVVTSYSSGSNYGDDEEEFYLDEIDDTCSYYIDLDDYDADYARITYDDDYVEVNKDYFYSNGTLKITAIDEGDSEVRIKFDSGETVYLYIYCGEDNYSSGYEDEEDYYVEKGESVSYYVDLNEYYADKATVTYSSTYVSVNKTTFYSNGSLKITAKKAGDSTVKIKYDSGDTVYLYIYCESDYNDYDEPYVSKEDLTVKKGSSTTFYVYLEGCDKATLSVDDSSVASISKYTIYNDTSVSVTGKSVGDTRIRVKFDDGSYTYVYVDVTSSSTSTSSGLSAEIEEEKIERDDYTTLNLETNSSFSYATVTVENPSALKLDVSNYSKYTKTYTVSVGYNSSKEIDIIGLEYGSYDVTVKFGTNNVYNFTIEVVDKIQKTCDGINSRGENYILNKGISLNNTVLNQGYINGYANGNFGPDLNITREEFGVMLSRILESEDKVLNSDYISDVTAEWSKEGIAELVAMGIVSKTNSYRPTDKITRSEVAEMIYNALDLSDFSDYCNLTDLTNSTLDKKIARCCNAGVIAGYPDRTFGGNNYITRAEAVTMLNRVFYKNNNSTKTNIFNDVNANHWAYSAILKASSR